MKTTWREGQARLNSVALPNTHHQAHTHTISPYLLSTLGVSEGEEYSPRVKCGPRKGGGEACGSCQGLELLQALYWQWLEVRGWGMNIRGRQWVASWKCIFRFVPDQG